MLPVKPFSALPVVIENAYCVPGAKFTDNNDDDDDYEIMIMMMMMMMYQDHFETRVVSILLHCNWSFVNSNGW